MQTIGAAQLAADHETWPDTELVAAVRAGDETAFAELFRRHYPPVVGYVRGYVRDTGRAEDVTQEAFFSALRRLRETESEINFRPWIHEIARNASIDLYRRSRRTREVSIDSDAGLPASDVARLEGGVPPEVVVIGRQRLEYLRGALDELSDTHQEVIVLRELEGLSYAEIGDRMQLSPSAVESTLFRARRRLEREYAELDTGRRCRMVTAAIARLAEGIYSDRDRRKLDRHCRRCSSCRVRARKLGVAPVSRRSLAARAAAFLPLPAFLRRRGDSMPSEGAGAVAGQGGPSLLAAQPAFEAAASKAVAILAAVAVVGGGGATLGGAGPLAAEGAAQPPAATGATQRPALDKGANPAPVRSPRTAEPRRATGATMAPERAARQARKGAGSVKSDSKRGATPPPPRAEQPPEVPSAPEAPPLPDSGGPAAPSGAIAPQADVRPASPQLQAPPLQLAAPTAPSTGAGATAPIAEDVASLTGQSL